MAMTNQQQPRTSFEALAQTMDVDVLRRQEAQIQQEVRETGLPEWQVREEAYRAREAERHEMIRLTELRVRELRDPRVRAAREAREQAEAAREAAADRVARWQAWLAEHPRSFDRYGNPRAHDPSAPPAWFIWWR